MFTIKRYKKFALMQLKARWKVPIIASLIVIILTFILQSNNIRAAFSSSASTQEAGDALTFMRDLLALLLSFIIQYSYLSLFITMSHSPSPVTFQNFLEGFSAFARAILAGVIITFRLMLWSFLFVIPAIVKAFSYSQTLYLLIEYPSMSINKAIKISNIITGGHKLDLLVLEFSFLAWFALSCVTLGAGFLFLLPYMHLTLINAYHDMLKEAVYMGKIKVEDLT